MDELAEKGYFTLEDNGGRSTDLDARRNYRSRPGRKPASPK